MAGQMSWDEMLTKMKEKKENGGYEKKDYSDPNIYKPQYTKEPDEKGVFPITRKLIRWIGTPEVMDVLVVSHSFYMNGMWYIANCIQHGTQNYGSCPVCDHVYKNKLYGTEGGKPFAKRFNRFSNVLIKKDALNPELENTVKVFGYGNELYKILENAMFPIEDELGEKATPILPWNTDNAPDFKLTIAPKKMPNTNKTKKNPSDFVVLPQYGKSEFGKEFNKVDMSALKLIDMSYLTKFEDDHIAKTTDRFNKIMGIKKTIVKGADFEKEEKAEVDKVDAPNTEETFDNDDDFINSLRENQ